MTTLRIKKLLNIQLLVALSCINVHAKHIHSERYYQELWCNDNKGIMEYKLDDYTRVDCLTDTHAIEFDFANKWAESIGQALYYSFKTNKKAGIGLILEKEKDIIYYNRILPLCKFYNVDLYKIELKEGQ